MKELCIQRHTLINEQSKLKIQFLSYLDRVFPELEHVVSKKGIHSKALRAILKEYPTASRISHVRIDRLIHLASEASAEKFKEDKIRKIKEAAKTSVSFDSAALALKIKQTVETLEHLKRQIDEINTAIEQQSSVIESPLHKIKGISSIEIAYIMSAIINISRFDSVKKVVAYAGLDPKIRQSSTFSAYRTRMSKLGNKLLRNALIWAANNVRKHNADMEAYYSKKRSKGKSHYNALRHCAIKLIRYIYWVLHHPDEEFIN